EDLVSTESNLDSTVLSKISSFLNLGKEWFELREKYINNFVGCRNSIAHGDGRQVSKEEFYGYLEGIKNLLTLYKEKLLDRGKPK
ncbi:MAE_28990/MAE_18760 family HEPN-like nuclease, partial [uncultured Desulfovibrio sp.]